MPRVFNPRMQRNRSVQCNVATPRDSAACLHLCADIRNLITPFMLRRTRLDVTRDLQDKQIIRVALPAMLPAHRVVYASVVLRLQTPHLHPHDTERNGTPAALSLLHRVAQHPLHARTRFSDPAIAGIAQVCVSHDLLSQHPSLAAVSDALSTKSDIWLHRLCLEHPPLACYAVLLSLDNVLAAVKCMKLADMLPRLLHDGHRPVVVSQWGSQLDIIELLFAHLGIVHSRLDASTPPPVRAAVVEAWESSKTVPDAGVLLATKDVFSSGLSLPGVDTVIIHDVSIDPRVDLDVENAARSLGSGTVTVFRLLAGDSVDQVVNDHAQCALANLLRDRRLSASGVDAVMTIKASLGCRPC